MIPLAVAGASEIGRGPGTPIAIPDAAGLAVLAVLELVALGAVARIWRARGRSIVARAFWTVVTLVPVLGLVAYAVAFDPPPPSDPVDRPPPGSPE